MWLPAWSHTRILYYTVYSSSNQYPALEALSVKVPMARKIKVYYLAYNTHPPGPAAAIRDCFRLKREE